ncbi:hypothetical protein PLESTB_000582600 [Pleodorina starrii]|uniref:Uncharacterized protein n=1 Tax=Pleodorina starrii TaxID=330485 RepID=A0A9W6BHA4_9CHLO|nr:hypothetical protein PLESTB_000582600 [Pleodorina starrii]GLC72246.1 hypothetical protein PLESTF_001223200 [Pleodorina starrii]
MKIRDGKNDSKGFTAIQDACREAAKRAGSELDGFHTSSPHWVHRTIWRLASRQLRSLEMACPSNNRILLVGEQLLQITSAFPLLEELSLRGYLLETNPELELGGQAAGEENELDADEEDGEEDDDDYGEGEGDDYDADEDTEDGDRGEDAQHEAAEGPQQPAEQQQAAADQQQEAGEQPQAGEAGAAAAAAAAPGRP